MPRLLAAGADLDRLYFVEAVANGISGTISLPDDIDLLSKRADEVEARFIGLDPLVAPMPAKINSWRTGMCASCSLHSSGWPSNATPRSGVIHLKKEQSSHILAEVSASGAFRSGRTIRPVRRPRSE